MDEVTRSGDGVSIGLALEPSESTRATWSHEFRVVARFEIGAALRISLEVENRSDALFSFEEALHTYLRVGDAARASITGPGGQSIPRQDGRLPAKTLGPEPFQLAAETDRVFLDTRGPVRRDRSRRLDGGWTMEKAGSQSTVVWNPWRDKSAAMADLGAEQWRSMLCVETANVGVRRRAPRSRRPPLDEHEDSELDK